MVKKQNTLFLLTWCISKAAELGEGLVFEVVKANKVKLRPGFES